MSHCVNDRKAAVFVCVQCAKRFCTDCAVHGGSEHASVLICPECGNRLDPIAVREVTGPALTFRHYLITAPTWPISGRGLFVLFLNALFVCGILLLAPVVYGFVADVHFVLGIIAAALFWFVAGGYLVLLLFETIRKTALREVGPPGAPSEASPPYMVRAVIRLAGILIFWTLPAVVVAYLADGTPATWERFGIMTLSNVGTLVMLAVRSGHSLVVRVLAAVGAFMVPMSLLAVARLDSIRGLNPFPLVPRILRTLGQYVSTCLAFYAVPVAIAVLYVHAFAKTMRAYGALDNLSGFTELDPGAYVLFFAACFIVVYGVFLVGRILGGLGAANAERYEWE